MTRAVRPIRSMSTIANARHLSGSIAICTSAFGPALCGCERAIDLRRAACIHSEDCAGDVSSALAEEEFHRGGNIRDVRQTAEGAAPDDLITLFRPEFVRH